MDVMDSSLMTDTVELARTGGRGAMSVIGHSMDRRCV